MEEQAKEAPMAAEILGCGHASQLFKVDYLEDAPQVHLHYLTDDDEFNSSGYGQMEMCCHGCGASLLILYTDHLSRRQQLAIRNGFEHRHRRCPNRKYEEYCSNYRSRFDMLDVRQKRLRRRGLTAA